MTRKDKRSLILSLVLGDGCLFTMRRGNRYFGGLTIDHGIEQSDYQAWKAKLLSDILDRNVRVRTGHKGKSVQISVCWKRLKAWRKFCYPKGKKSIPNILRFINHPEFALGVLLMDDGYVESSISKLSCGTKKNYGARFRIFLCDQTEEQLKYVINWLSSNFNINAKIKWQKGKKKNYPFIKINGKDSLLIWKKMREFILQFKSMKYKFRYIEEIYQYKLIQRKLG